MAKTYKTYFKEKWLYFALSVVFYFAPFIVTTACLLPVVKAATGVKAAIGLGIIIINSIPFLMGVFRAFFAHFPMLNMVAVVFMCIYGFFALDAFMKSREVFCWIELAAALGSIVSCVFWGLHLKYADYRRSVKATVGSGAFVLK